MKQLEVLLLYRGWDASSRPQDFPSIMSPVPIYVSRWRETVWSKVSFLKKTTIIAETRPSTTNPQIESPLHKPPHHRADSVIDYDVQYLINNF